MARAILTAADTKALFGLFFLSLNFHYLITVTHYSLLITYHSSLITLNTTPVWHYHPIFFTLFVGFISIDAAFFFLFSPEHEDRTSEKKKKKKNRTANPGEERKKKVKRLSKGAVEYCLWVPYVYLITILPLSYELWKQCYRLPNNLFAMGPTIFEL